MLSTNPSHSTGPRVQPQLVNATPCSHAEATRLLQHHGSGGPKTNVVICNNTFHANGSSFSRISIPVVYDMSR